MTIEFSVNYFLLKLSNLFLLQMMSLYENESIEFGFKNLSEGNG